MKLKIGFATPAEETENVIATEPEETVVTGKVCLVRIYFSARNLTLTYLNDKFVLKRGDYVYVDGKLEGLLGRVEEVSYSFKIKSADYQRVISVVDTGVQGKFFFAGAHFVTFDPAALSYEKAAAWLKAPVEEDGVIKGDDDTAFCLHDFGSWDMKPHIMDRGHEYYVENRVRYLCLNGENGRALVEGSSVYEVEFRYRDGVISELVCDCFCVGGCKHEVAALMQLRELLETVFARFSGEYEKTGYFAAVFKPLLFTFAVDGNQEGSLTMGG